MANKRTKPEEIVSKLRQVEVLMGQGMSRRFAQTRSRLLRVCRPPDATVGFLCERAEALLARCWSAHHHADPYPVLIA